jgi:hypothetical protein
VDFENERNQLIGKLQKMGGTIRPISGKGFPGVFEN